MQNFKVISGTDYMARSREPINNNFKTLMSNFSGDSFPTSELQPNMTCYRTDQNKLYRLGSDLRTWRMEVDYTDGSAVSPNARHAEKSDNATEANALLAGHIVDIQLDNSKTGLEVTRSQNGKETKESMVFNLAKEAIRDMFYPVGHVIFSASSTNPSEYIGGTWKQISEGTFIVAAGDSAKYRQGTTGGEAEHVLSIDEMPSHKHDNTISVSTKDASVPDHIHATGYHNGNNTGRWLSTGGTATDYPLKSGTTGAYWNGSGGGGNSGQSTKGLNLITSLAKADSNSVYESHNHGVEASVEIANTGGGKAHNNLPPYLAMYIWQRIA